MLLIFCHACDIICRYTYIKRIRIMIISFFGHSDFSGTAECKDKIIEFLSSVIANEPTQIYLGGYGAFDEFAYKCCDEYKKSHSNVTLIFVTPYLTLDYQKNHLSNIRTKYDEIIYPEIEGVPLKYAIVYRNRWMIDRSDIVVFGVSHKFGGAFKSYEYAKGKGKRIYNVLNL